MIFFFQRNTICEEIDLSDNYIEGSGANSLANMLQDNMFIVNLVSLISQSLLLRSSKQSQIEIEMKNQNRTIPQAMFCS